MDDHHDHEPNQHSRYDVALPDQGGRDHEAHGDPRLGPQHAGPAGSGGVRQEQWLIGAEPGRVVGRQAYEEREAGPAERPDDEERNRQVLRRSLLAGRKLRPGGPHVGVLEQVARRGHHGQEQKGADREDEDEQGRGHVAERGGFDRFAHAQRPGDAASESGGRV